MKIKFSTAAALSMLLTTFVSAFAAETHRVLILDVLTRQGGPNSRIRVFEIESGKVLAQADLGEGPEIGLSPKRDVVAVLTYNLVAGVAQANSRLETYATANLTRLERGLLPFLGRMGFQEYATAPTLAFSPDGQEVIIQRMESFYSDEKPLRWPVNNVIWSFVKRELNPDGLFKLSRPDVKIPRCRLTSFLGVSEWPRVHIWNSYLAVVEVVDVSSGKILSRLPLDYEDDPALALLDPAYLERPNIGELYMHLGANGVVFAGSGRYAYYVPRPTRNIKVKSGVIQKVDLSADPPKVTCKGEKREAGLLGSCAGVSELGGGLFAAVEKQKNGSTGEPSRKVRIYSTLDLKYQNEIELSLPSCDSLRPSLDGKFMYALNRQQAKLAVIDIATGTEVKVLERVGKYPCMVVALPETKAEK